MDHTNRNKEARTLWQIRIKDLKKKKNLKDLGILDWYTIKIENPQMVISEDEKICVYKEDTSITEHSAVVALSPQGWRGHAALYR